MKYNEIKTHGIFLQADRNIVAKMGDLRNNRILLQLGKKRNAPYIWFLSLRIKFCNEGLWHHGFSCCCYWARFQFYLNPLEID